MKYVIQVVINTPIIFFCTGIYFYIDTGTKLIPAFVKKENQNFKKFDKFNRPKMEKLNFFVWFQDTQLATNALPTPPFTYRKPTFPFTSTTLFTGSAGPSEVIKVKLITLIVNHNSRILHKTRDIGPELVEFSYISFFVPNHGRILPALTYNVSQPLDVNTGRILPGFGRKFGNIGKHECSRCSKLEYNSTTYYVLIWN